MTRLQHARNQGARHRAVGHLGTTSHYPSRMPFRLVRNWNTVWFETAETARGEL